MIKVEKCIGHYKFHDGFCVINFSRLQFDSDENKVTFSFDDGRVSGSVTGKDAYDTIRDIGHLNGIEMSFSGSVGCK